MSRSDILPEEMAKEEQMKVYLYDVSYYLPGTPGGGGGDYQYIAENKTQIRNKINALHKRKDRMVGGEDTLKIEMVEEVEFPFKLG